MKKIIIIFTFMLSITNLTSMNTTNSQINRRATIYKHSPGHYTTEFSPRGTTLHITKDNKSESASIKLSKNMQKLCQEHAQLKNKFNDTHDSNNQKLYNK